MNGRTFLILSLAMAGAAPARAQSATAGAAPRLATEWIAAFNSGDSAQIARFEREHYAVSALPGGRVDFTVARDRWRYLNLGPATLVKVEESSDTAASLLVHNAQVDSWGHVRVRLSPADGRIVRLDLTRHEARPSGAAAPARLTDVEVLAALDTFAARLAREGKFSGVVGVVHDGRTVGTRAYGFADRDARRVNNLDSRFELASVGKLFSGVVIAKLVERGTLSYEDTLGRWLPDYPNATARRTVTIRHLLTHSSGIADFFMNPAWAALSPEDKGKLSLADHYRFFAADSLAFTPGTRSAYSNSGFLLLGLIAERATHTPYDALYRKLVFEPAGMRDTWVGADASERARKYTFYTPSRALDFSRARVAEDELPVGTPAGGGITTVGDLSRFAAALMQGTIISRSSLETMLARHGIDETPSSWSGYAFDSVELSNGTRVANKGGYTFGAHAQFDLYPDRGLAVVVLSNVDMWGAEAIVMKGRGLVAR